MPSSEYRPPAGTQAIIRSPFQFRPRKNKFVGTCDLKTSSFSSNDDDDHHRDTPSRPRPSSNSINSHTSSNPLSQTSGRGGKEGAYSGAYSQIGRFCTPNCLMGMIIGGNSIGSVRTSKNMERADISSTVIHSCDISASCYAISLTTVNKCTLMEPVNQRD